MATFGHIVFMALDELKLYSGDSDYTEDHMLFLAQNLRAYLLERKYADPRNIMNPDNLQEICLGLEQVQAIPGTDCGGVYLRSTSKIPTSLIGWIPVITTGDVLGNSRISFVEPQQMQYAGQSRWTNKLIYATIASDGYLYLKSNNPQFLYLKKLRMTGLFSEIQDAAKMSCDNCDCENCDIMESRFPLENGLITLLVQSMVQELSGQRYLPKDKVNNSQDDMAGQASATPRNINKNYVQE